MSTSSHSFVVVFFVIIHPTKVGIGECLTSTSWDAVALEMKMYDHGNMLGDTKRDMPTTFEDNSGHNNYKSITYSSIETINTEEGLGYIIS